MNRLITLAVLVSGMALSVGAADTPTEAPAQDMGNFPIRKMTPEMRKKLGDLVEKPGSQKGKLALIDTQGDVKGELFSKLASVQGRRTGFNMVYEKVAAGDPAALKNASKADVAVIIVADDKAPILLAAVEDGWAVVNIRKLTEGFTNPEAKAKFYEARCEKEVLRALAIVGGGVSSQYPNNLMDITSIRDLDLVGTFIPNDTGRNMKKVLATRGVTPLERAFYSQACRMGWAPAPTNENQKAIWDRVHALPTKPIKIKYDPKKGE